MQISHNTSNNNSRDQMDCSAICSEIKWNYLLKSSKTMIPFIMLELADAAKTNSRLLNQSFAHKRNHTNVLNINSCSVRNPFYGV